MTAGIALRLALVAGAAAAAAALLLASLPRWRAYEAASRPTATQPPARQAAARSAKATATVARVADLRLVAARGSCWVVVRAGSAAGAIRYAGTVRDGARVRVRGARLWVRLGAAGNVEGRLNGRPLGRLPTGTVNLVVTARGVSLGPVSAIPRRSL